MKTKVDESKLIDYLYGNLSLKEKEAVGQAIKADHELKSKLDELRQVREFMGKLEDKEVIPPAFVFGSEETGQVPFFKSKPFRLVASIAASLALLMLFANLSGLNVSKTDQGMQIGFNASDAEAINKEDVRSIMQEVLAAYNKENENKLAALENKLASELAVSKQENMDALKQYIISNSNESQAIMRRYISQANAENQQMISEYVNVSAEQQREYLNTIMVDFSGFYNNQRKVDLEMIRTGILDWKNLNDVKQYETDLILASLIDIVNTQYK